MIITIKEIQSKRKSLLESFPMSVSANQGVSPTFFSLDSYLDDYVSRFPATPYAF